MDSVVIDTNPLVYIYGAVQELGKKYAVVLGKLTKRHILIIPKIVYGELSLIFRDVNELNDFLKDTGIVIDNMMPEVYLIAARRWEKYNKRRILMCHKCGLKFDKMTCSKCGSQIKIRQHILTDFLIGACALQVQGQKIVTHDRGYYSTYFPELNIITSDFSDH